MTTCQWCGDDSHRCEQINGSCGWLMVASTYWDSLNTSYMRSSGSMTGLVPFERATDNVRRAHATACRIAAERHHTLATSMLPPS